MQDFCSTIIASGSENVFPIIRFALRSGAHLATDSLPDAHSTTRSSSPLPVYSNTPENQKVRLFFPPPASVINLQQRFSTDLVVVLHPFVASTQKSNIDNDSGGEIDAYLSQKLPFTVGSSRLEVCHHLGQLRFGLFVFIPVGFRRSRGLLRSTFRNRLK